MIVGGVVVRSMGIVQMEITVWCVYFLPETLGGQVAKATPESEHGHVRKWFGVFFQLCAGVVFIFLAELDRFLVMWPQRKHRHLTLLHPENNLCY